LRPSPAGGAAFGRSVAIADIVVAPDLPERIVRGETALERRQAAGLGEIRAKPRAEELELLHARVVLCAGAPCRGGCDRDGDQHQQDRPNSTRRPLFHLSAFTVRATEFSR